ncbi:MAG: oligosaccharide flippase family protein, partial [Bacteroidota bacterium]
MRQRLQHILNKFRQLHFFESLKHTSTLFTATLLTQVLGIISLRVYTYFFDDEQYGIINVYLSYATAFSIILTFNLNGAISRYYFEEKPDYRTFNGTSLIASYAVLTILSGIILFFRVEIANWINLPVQVIPLLIVFIYTIVLWRAYEAFFIARKQTRLFAISHVVHQYTKFGAALIGLLLVTGTSVYMGKLAGELIPAILMAVFVGYKLWPHIDWTLSKAHLIYILKYCLPLIPLSLSSFILQYFDQWHINKTLGNGDAGLYSFA